MSREVALSRRSFSEAGDIQHIAMATINSSPPLLFEEEMRYQGLCLARVAFASFRQIVTKWPDPSGFCASRDFPYSHGPVV
jgi:hypothetical protein